MFPGIALVSRTMPHLILLLLSICCTLPFIANGHFQEQDDFNGVTISSIHFDRSEPLKTDDLVYYSYHIHVYFSPRSAAQRNEAMALRTRFRTTFNVTECPNRCDTWCPRICSWNFNAFPVGPHPIGSWGIYLPLEHFTRAVSFVSMYHGNLTVLVHPNSGRPKIDHLLNALWIKSVLPLNANQLQDNVPLPSV